MQSRLDIKILPLKPQVLLNLVHHQLLNRTPRPVLRLPDDLTFGIGHFQRCADLVGVAFDLGLFGNASAQTVVLVTAGAFHLRVSHGLGFDQAIFAVVGEGLPAHDADDFFDQVAPGVVFVLVVRGCL